MLGRFDPKTGQVKEWPSPEGRIRTLRDHPDQQRDLVRESGVRPNTMVRFDPKTEKFQTFAIPSGGGVLRHFEATARATS